MGFIKFLSVGINGNYIIIIDWFPPDLSRTCVDGAWTLLLGRWLVRWMPLLCIVRVFDESRCNTGKLLDSGVESPCVFCRALKGVRMFDNMFE